MELREPIEVLTIDEAVRRFRAALLDWKAKRELVPVAQRAQTEALRASEAAHEVLGKAKDDLLRAVRMQEPPIDWPDWGARGE